jgi:hypothetical protein
MSTEEYTTSLPFPLEHVSEPNLESRFSELEPDVSNEASTWDWIRRQKTKLIVGAAAVSAGVTLATDPLEDTKDRVFEAAPWVASGLLAGEVLWIGGAAMMLGAVGNKIGNPLKIKKKVPELAMHANNSMLFKSGFWINTGGAVAQTGVLVAGVTSELPAKSWGILGLALADFALTISVRRAIRKGVRNNTPQTPPSEF